MKRQTIRSTGQISSDDSAFNSSIAHRVVELLDTPFDEYDTSDLRFVINQEIALMQTVPIALEVLKRDLFVETEYYEGDLLKAMLTVPISFWQQNPKYYSAFQKLIEEQIHKIHLIDVLESVKQELTLLTKNFT